MLLGGFHALGNHFQPQGLAQGDDGVDDGLVVRVREQVAHKALVDLDLVQRHALEVAQAGIAGAKVIQRKTHPQRAQGGHGGDGGVQIIHKQAFGQFQLESVGRYFIHRQRACHVVHKVLMVELL